MVGIKGMRMRGSGELDIWATRYNAGEGLHTLASEHGASIDSVRQALKRRGVCITPLPRGAPRRYTCNETFFDKIDNELKAYWLGFIAADGNVHRQTLSFGLGVQDTQHLHAFLAAIDGAQPVVVRTKVDDLEVASLKINSKQLVSALLRHGITTRKSLTLNWSSVTSQVPNHLLHHLIRGYIDGNGSWHWQRSRVGRPSWHCSFVGSSRFVAGAQQALAAGAQLRITTLSPTKTAGVARVAYGGNRQVARIAHWLYDSATIYLPRKKALADAAIAEAAKTLHGWAAHPDGCLRCGRTSVPYSSHGLCRYCANTVWRHRHDTAPVQHKKRRP